MSAVAVSRDEKEATVAVGMTIRKETDFGLGAIKLVTPPDGGSNGGDGVLLVLDQETRDPKWNVRIGGTNTTEPDDIDDVAFDLAGNVTIVGKNRSPDSTATPHDAGTVALPNPPPQPLSTGGSGGWGAFVVKLSPTGTLLWAKGVASSNYDDAVGMHRVELTRSGSMRVSGGLQGIAALGAGLPPYEAGVALYRQVLWGFGP